MKAVKGIPATKQFGLCTPHGPEIQRTASNLITWMNDGVNEDTLSSFCVQLGIKLKNCLKYRGKSFKNTKFGDNFIRCILQMISSRVGMNFSSLLLKASDLLFSTNTSLM